MLYDLLLILELFFADEAALYDRQIRLWGLEAQGRIRDAHIFVVNLDGLTTEAIKNWVLAGIHRLTLIDAREVTSAHDLSAGFFWREDDVGHDRLNTAAKRIQALNPLVKIDVLPTTSIEHLFGSSDDLLASLKPDVLVLGLPSGPERHQASLWTLDSIASLNDKARTLNIKFYCTGMQGFDGWLFSDLGDAHDYVVEKPGINAPLPASTVEGAAVSASAPPSKDDFSQASNGASSSKRLEKRRQRFVPLNVALSMSWKGLSRSQLRRQKPSLGLFGVLAAWTLNSHGKQPTADKLKSVCIDLLLEHGVDQTTVLPNSEEERKAYFAALETALSLPGQFSPSCAIVGGVLAQDVLNAVGGREEPLVNWFQLEGLTASGTVHALSIPSSASINV